MDMPGARAFSFPKTRRLTHAADFERVKREGRVERGRFMVISVLAVQNSGASRVGFITSRHLGRAVFRNRVRRRLREMVRSHLHDLREDFWIVLVARHDAASASYGVLEVEWLRLAKRASILAA